MFCDQGSLDVTNVSAQNNDLFLENLEAQQWLSPAMINWAEWDASAIGA
jgi:hypothetical protein